MQFEQLSVFNKSRWPLRGFLGFLVVSVALFLVIPLFTKSFWAHVVMQTCFTLLILSTTYTLAPNRSTLVFGFILILLFAGLDVASTLNNSLILMLIAYSFYCIFVAFTVFSMAKRLIKNGLITTDLIFGAITIYLLAGILWAKLFFITDLLNPNSFHGIRSLDLFSQDLTDGYILQFNLLYFSFTTLATLGLGDITPLHPMAKSLTILEATFGQLFVATVIAKMVSVWKE